MIPELLVSTSNSKRWMLVAGGEAGHANQHTTCSRKLSLIIGDDLRESVGATS